MASYLTDAKHFLIDQIKLEMCIGNVFYKYLDRVSKFWHCTANSCPSAGNINTNHFLRFITKPAWAE